MKTHCFPVPESQFQSVIRGNYYRPRHFFFELDHEQTRALISLFKPAPVHDVPNKWDPSRSMQSPTVEAYVNPGHAKPESYIKDLNPFDVSSESHCIDPYKLVDPDGEYASASRTSTSHLDDESSNWDDLDDVATKEGTEFVNDDHPRINPQHNEQYGTVLLGRNYKRCLFYDSRRLNPPRTLLILLQINQCLKNHSLMPHSPQTHLIPPQRVMYVLKT